jgi:hypothetical protein
VYELYADAVLEQSQVGRHDGLPDTKPLGRAPHAAELDDQAENL